MLQADKLQQDPRVVAAKQTLLEAVREHSTAITGPKPPDPKHTAQFRAQSEESNDVRGRGLALPYLASGIGNGAWVELTDGSVKLDFISGIGVHILGHSHPLIVESGIDAALTDTVMQGNLQMAYDSIELGRLLLDLANQNGAALGHCFLSTSGAMANENALKVAFQNKAPASRVLAFEGAFAGRSMATCQITARAAYRKGLPVTLNVDRVPYFDHQAPKGSTKAALDAIEKHLAAFPGEHALMVVEPILGEGGFYPGSSTFFEAIMTRLHDAGVLIFMDEVQSFGRTSMPFAFQHFGLDRFADIVSIGKMTQVCATLYRPELNPDPALLSQTFTASTSAIRAALAILNEFQNGDYFGPEGKILRLGSHFAKRLGELAEKHPDLLEGPFGLGGMVGMTPFGGDPKKAMPFVKQLFTNGLMGFPAGKEPARVRFLLPYGAIDEQEIDVAVGLIEKTLIEFQS
tara:strand:- start:1872 stop:3254 length:1383 start_codon:yes stop_codon:yes gene_type:complete